MRDRLKEYAGTTWKGEGELWLDPEGNSAEVYDCDLNIESDAIHYAWLYKGETHHGSFTLKEDGVNWEDDFHQQKPVLCSNVPRAWGILTIFHEYEVPENPNWGWRTNFSERPDNSLVLQMTNITPWGEEGRAVRMVFRREND